VERLRLLIHEVHRRFVWQTLAIYLIVAFITFHVSQHVAARRDLPDWFVDLAILLLAIGLPTVIATACVQEGIPTPGHMEPTPPVDADSDRADTEVRSSVPGVRQVLTWRNAVLGGTAAFTLWALAAAGWVLLTDKHMGDSGSRTINEASIDGK
jgi:hypothetical protein